MTRTELMRKINNLMTAEGCSLTEDQDAVLTAALGAMWEEMHSTAWECQYPPELSPVVMRAINREWPEGSPYRVTALESAKVTLKAVVGGR